MPVGLTRRKDGILEIQVSMREFSFAWQGARHEDKLVLEGSGVSRRPALWVDKSRARSVMTPFPMHWEEFKRRQRRGLGGPTSRERACAVCGAVLKLSKETTDMWTFYCEVCESIEAHGKQTVGGTFGAGEAEPDSV